MTFKVKERVTSFKFAFRGIYTLIKTQHNAWIHLLATMVVVFLGFYAGLSFGDWSLIVIAIVIVWLAEALNTAVELLADKVSSEHHPLIGKAKDVAAAAVLISAIGSILIGIFVFLPYFEKMLE